MVHFQFIQEETATDRNADVAYCYEIQVDRRYQSLGIGAYLLGILEDICRETMLEKVMMTVFKANKRAIQFYIEKLGGRASRFDYEILSKMIEP
ncbi:N-alpha-acetyltransferase 40 [Actinomortierella ambigua]|nr:N-alpha-acetyltransferase 40 [Actinomortierella ambigua]